MCLCKRPGRRDLGASKEPQKLGCFKPRQARGSGSCCGMAEPRGRSRGTEQPWPPLSPCCPGDIPTVWERGHSRSVGPAQNCGTCCGELGTPLAVHSGSDEYPTGRHSQPLHPSSGTGQGNCHPTTPSALSSPEPLRSPFSHRVYQRASDRSERQARGRAGCSRVLSPHVCELSFHSTANNAARPVSHGRLSFDPLVYDSTEPPGR